VNAASLQSMIDDVWDGSAKKAGATLDGRRQLSIGVPPCRSVSYRPRCRLAENIVRARPLSRRGMHHQGVREREREFICQVKTITIFNNNRPNELQWQAARKGKCPSMLATINTLDNNTTK